MSENSETSLSGVDCWLRCIRHWYPDLHTKTYFIPPVYFNRIQYTQHSIAGQDVLVPGIPEGGVSQPCASTSTSSSQQSCLLQPVNRVLDSDTRDDRAQERVLLQLCALAEMQKEAMVVVSQLKFGQYLNMSCFAAAAAHFPRPPDLPEPYRQGDFDLLIIHKQYGLITGEVKSVGANFSQLNQSPQKEASLIVQTVQKAVKQLNKGETVLKHLVSDLTGVKVFKILILPFITSETLAQTLGANDRAARALGECLGIPDQPVTECVSRCLCADQLSDTVKSGQTSNTALAELSSWWIRQAAGTWSGATLAPDVYEQLVVRFCGPATTVTIYCVSSPRLTIRTQGEGVSETGERMARLVLLPEQLELLNLPPRHVFLTGPPGTGKTVLLLLQGLQWLQHDHDVHVVSMWTGSRAASIVIEHELVKTMALWSSEKKFSKNVVRHHCDGVQERDVIAFARNLVTSLETGCELHVLVDEAGPDDSNNFTCFCDKLICQVPEVNLWAAAAKHHLRPPCLPEVKLTSPLRSPPVVVREVKGAAEIQRLNHVYDYTDSVVLAPTDGPRVKRIVHEDGKSDHCGRRAENCEACGIELTRVFAELEVGGMVMSATAGANNGPPPLKWSDVIVMCDFPREDRTDNNGRIMSQDIGLVRGMRAWGVPVRVVEKGAHEDAIRDTALAACDQVTVTHRDEVRGLERKVVVLAGCGGERNVMYDRLHAASRCSAQLVWIHCK